MAGFLVVAGVARAGGVAGAGIGREGTVGAEERGLRRDAGRRGWCWSLRARAPWHALGATEGSRGRNAQPPMRIGDQCFSIYNQSVQNLQICLKQRG